MSNTPPPSNSTRIDAVYAQLNRRDIEEFYSGYQRWSLQQQIAAIQIRLDDLRQQIAANTERIQEVQPTAIALATLARLQSNGVSDVALLDRMLEQGELWLDRTMQRLDYFEKLDDFISDGYTEWCKHALEGAYDWIDSILDGSPSSSPPNVLPGEESLTEATEELILQKLSTGEYEDESSMLETTLKRPAISITHPEEPALQEYSASEAPLSVESGSISESEHSPIQDLVEVSPAIGEPADAPPEPILQSDEPEAAEVYTLARWNNETRIDESAPEDSRQPEQSETPKRPNLLRRFIEKVWGGI